MKIANKLLLVLGLFFYNTSSNLVAMEDDPLVIQYDLERSDKPMNYKNLSALSDNMLRKEILPPDYDPQNVQNYNQYELDSLESNFRNYIITIAYEAGKLTGFLNTKYEISPDILSNMKYAQKVFPRIIKIYEEELDKIQDKIKENLGDIYLWKPTTQFSR